MSITISNSVSFKSLDRQRPPNWSNRFRRDVNDLIYDTKLPEQINYIKKSPEYIKKELKRIQRLQSINRNPIKKAMEKYGIQKYVPGGKDKNQHLKRSQSTKQSNLGFTQTRSTFFKGQQQNSPTSKHGNPQDYQNVNKRSSSSQNLRQKIYNNPNNQKLFRTTDLFYKKSKTLQNVSQVNSPSKGHPQINNYGLSMFQFDSKTIQGKIHSRYGYNVDLSKCKTMKINNINPVYYSKNDDLNFCEYQKRRGKEILNTFRDFRSYSGHKLYVIGETGQGGMLDKVYDVDKEKLDMVKKRGSMDIDFQKMSARPQITKKLGTQLQYKNAYKQIAKSNKQRPLYETQLLQRKLNIGKQVIDQKRGCYR